MKIAIICVLLVFVAILLTMLYLLFQPGRTYRSSQSSPRARQAAVGRAVLEAARSDLLMAEMVRAAVQSATEEDRTLAADLIAELPQR